MWKMLSCNWGIQDYHLLKFNKISKIKENYNIEGFKYQQKNMNYASAIENDYEIVITADTQIRQVDHSNINEIKYHVIPMSSLTDMMKDQFIGKVIILFVYFYQLHIICFNTFRNIFVCIYRCLGCRHVYFRNFANKTPKW